MAKDTNGNGSGAVKLTVKIIGLILSAITVFGAGALAWTSLNSRVACMEARQDGAERARDKFEHRTEGALDRVNRKLDALILHTGAKAPK